ncbi:vacuolar protein sorting complex subunit [Strigomonas culicis]|uniref:Vacuolar protein sorting complex subunit n=1 Tax=Strigomonas culicis TaxID=28005 RepID=S9U247_9TRYP|nr:vacuolar protein sorting complex subunit [Strigomonas culicis]|eukprot:EPY23013.1 vacuolar protein sorting complex subunit [Strigomonas culicis]
MQRKRHYERTARCGSWISIGKDNMVRVLDFVDFSWDDSAWFKPKIACNRNGGHIAVHSQNKFYESDRNVVFLYTSNGKLSSTIKLKDSDVVSYLGWNYFQDHLIVVLGDGTAHFFNSRGEVAHSPFIIGVVNLVSSTQNGFAAVTFGASCLLSLVEFSKGGEYTSKTVSLPAPFSRPLSTLTLLAIPQNVSYTGYSEVLIPNTSTVNETKMFHCTISNQHLRCTNLKVSLEGGGLLSLALSSNGRSIAFLMESKNLFLTDTSFESVTQLFSVSNFLDKNMLSWCGNNCVVLGEREYEDDDYYTVHLVNTSDPSCTDNIGEVPGDVALVQECDGIRMISPTSYQFLQCVSESGVRVFSVGSRSPGAVLISTYDEFMSGNASAVGMLRHLQQNTDTLAEAINDCVLTAAMELDVEQQKCLLRIASFGKTFSPVQDTDSFLHTVRCLRVLNTLRATRPNMLLSLAQLQDLGEARLLQRLVRDDHYQIAYHVAETLDLEKDMVLREWAVSRLARSRTVMLSPQEEVTTCTAVIRKLKKCSCARIAEIAQEVNMRGKHDSAVQLLEAETCASRQIPMYLSISEPELALKRVAAVSDPDLAFTVIMFMLQSRAAGAVPLLLEKKLSRDIFLQLVRVTEGNRAYMRDFLNTKPHMQMALDLRRYLQEEDKLCAALANTRQEANWEMQQECKSAALQTLSLSQQREVAFSDGSHSSAAPSTTASQNAFHETMLRLQAKLIEKQTQLMKEMDDGRFLHASVVRHSAPRT